MQFQTPTFQWPTEVTTARHTIPLEVSVQKISLNFYRDIWRSWMAHFAMWLTRKLDFISHREHEIYALVTKVQDSEYIRFVSLSILVSTPLPKNRPSRAYYLTTPRYARAFCLAELNANLFKVCRGKCKNIPYSERLSMPFRWDGYIISYPSQMYTLWGSQSSFYYPLFSFSQVFNFGCFKILTMITAPPPNYFIYSRVSPPILSELEHVSWSIDGIKKRFIRNIQQILCQ